MSAADTVTRELKERDRKAEGKKEKGEESAESDFCSMVEYRLFSRRSNQRFRSKVSNDIFHTHFSSTCRKEGQKWRGLREKEREAKIFKSSLWELEPCDAWRLLIPVEWIEAFDNSAYPLRFKFSNGCKAVLRDCDNLPIEACNPFSTWWKQICCDKRVEMGLRLSWDFITATKLVRFLSCYLSDCSILLVISRGSDRKKTKKKTPLKK